MNSRRLEAEAVRDSILSVAGNLDSTLGGPELPHEEGQTSPRRSLYFRHAEEKQMAFLTAFDGPSVNECYRRSESVVPQQALALVNSQLSLDQSRLLAKKLSDATAANATSADAASQSPFVTIAFHQILARDPQPEELSHCVEFLAAQEKLLATANSLTPFTGGIPAAVAPAADARQRAREGLVHALFNHNDFITIR